MKKILSSLVMSTLLISPLTTNVYADNSNNFTDENGGETDIPISASISKMDNTISDESSYYVLIEWKTTPGSYQLSKDTYSWNAKEMKYIKNNDTCSFKPLNDAETTITISNQSNKSIDYNISFESVENMPVNEVKANDSANERNGSIEAMVDGTEDISHGGDEIEIASIVPKIVYKGQISLSNYMQTVNNLLIGNYKVTVKSSATQQPESDEIVDKIKSVNTLYENGENNLTENDIVTINNIDCYVLQRTDKNAELITKNTYEALFDTDTTYGDYEYHKSSFATFMNRFYNNELGQYSRIIDTSVISYSKNFGNTYYGGNTYNDDFESYDKTTITQKVFALDAIEAKTNYSKFSISNFWVSAGFRIGAYSNYDAYAYTAVNNSSVLYPYKVTDNKIKARPAFWVTLD